jgi:protein arginine kinase
LDWSELASFPLAWEGNGDVSKETVPFVVLTRLQTSRNFQGFPFTVSAPPNICAAIADKALYLLAKSGKYTIRRLSDCPPHIIRLLRERHLLPDRALPFPGKKETKYLAIGPSGDNWALVNEVEHLTFGSILPGLLSQSEFVQSYPAPEESLNSIPAKTERAPWVYSQGLGYLTSNPCRIGPGLEVHFLVHLPGLALARQLQQARNTLAASGIGFFPATPTGVSEAGLFYVKSSGGAGRTPEGVYQDFLTRIQPILNWEKELQSRCLQQHPAKLEERVKVSLQGLSQASSMEYSDLLAMGSNVRLGAYLGIIDPKLARIMEVLRVTAGSGHLGVSSNQILPKEEEDNRRAKVVRLALEGLRN